MIVFRLRRFHLSTEGRALPVRQQGFRIEFAKNFDQQGDDAGSTRLVAGADAGTVVAVEILVEEDVILPIRIFLELFGSSVNRAPAVPIPQENTGESSSDFFGHFEQSHVPSGASWAFHLKVVAVELIQVQQSAYEQAIHGHPYGSSPIGVASEQTRSGLRWLVVYTELAAVNPIPVRSRLVIPRDRTNTVISKELTRVQHPPQHRFHAVASHQ